MKQCCDDIDLIIGLLTDKDTKMPRSRVYSNPKLLTVLTIWCIQSSSGASCFWCVFEMLHARFLIMDLVIGASVSNVLRKVIFERKTIFVLSPSLQFLTQHMEVLVSSNFCGLLFCRLSTLGSTFRNVT